MSNAKCRKTPPSLTLGSGPWLTLADLPPKDTKRWLPERKAVLHTAVRQGLLTLSDACQRYDLSIEEYLSWQWGGDGEDWC